MQEKTGCIFYLWKENGAREKKDVRQKVIWKNKKTHKRESEREKQKETKYKQV